MANYDILGNIAIIKFSKETKKEEKLEKARELLLIPSVKTVLEKVDKVKGRLRTIKTKYLAGEKNLIANYKESGCIFRLKVDSCYFSPRLASDRIEVARMINKKDKVLVMFSGVAPYPIIIGKLVKPKQIVAVELGKECCKYALENVNLNKISNLEIVQGDVKKIIPKLAEKEEKFDFIIMARPNLEESFIKEALLVAKKNTKIIFHGFWKESEKDEKIKDLEQEIKKLKRKVKIFNVKEIGDIAPYEHRYRVDMLVL